MNLGWREQTLAGKGKQKIKQIIQIGDVKWRVHAYERIRIIN